MALTHDQKRLLVGGSIGAVALFLGYELFRHKKEIVRPLFAPGQPGEEHEHRKKRRHHEDHHDDHEENDRGEYGRKKKHRRKEHERE